jgi:hypothetical protein
LIAENPEFNYNTAMQHPLIFKGTIMSRNSKTTRNLEQAKQITSLHLRGEKGAARTTPVHGKRHTYRNNPEAMKRLDEFMNGGKSSKNDRTSGKKILEKAGSAAVEITAKQSTYVG